MNRRIVKPATDEKETKTGGLPEACARYGLGKASMRKVAEDAGAVIRIGKRYLVNFSRVDLYMDSISQ